MAKPQRPTLSPPRRGIFEEMVDEAQGNGTAPAPTPAPAPAVEAAAEPEREPAPVPATAAAPTQEIELARPVQPAVPDARPVARRPGAARAGRQAPAPRPPAVAVPPAPPGFLTSKKPLQVKMDPQAHWDLKIGMTMRGRDMSSVVSALIGAFNADPDTWLMLMDRAVEERVGLGELLAPALEQLRDR